MPAFRALRYTAIAEGISYLILLFIAMPLKYGMGIEIAVRVVGMIHGILFLLLIYLLWRAWKTFMLELQLCILVFVASLIPFAAFWADRKLREQHRSV
ncbi:MAG: DUF3817 domain-containing protein [Verrucomicrobiota bacterium]